MAGYVGCDFTYVLSDEATRERIDKLGEDENDSFSVADISSAMI